MSSPIERFAMNFLQRCLPKRNAHRALSSLGSYIGGFGARVSRCKNFFAIRVGFLHCVCFLPMSNCMSVAPGVAVDHSDPALLTLLPPHVVKRYRAVALRRQEGRLVLGMADIGDLTAVDDLRALLGERFLRVQLAEARLNELMGEVLRGSQDVAGITQGLIDENGRDKGELAQVQAITDDAPIVKFVNMVILRAAEDRASDIHIEPTEHDLRIRVRIDGVLHEQMRQPKSIHSGVVSRLKVMSDIDIAERRKPQDGRMSVMIEGRAIDLRVSTLPTVYGEKLVMRILDQSSSILSLSTMGFLPEQLAYYESAYRKPYGALLVTGPTGSGKSTTLYATLSALNDPSRNIVTVEDPVEYRLPNINQVQTNNRAGLTFASALRSILRQDPDIVLVGEIRDRETGVIAIEAALTGHLVLSTLHTNDAPSTPLRLLEMGIEPFLIAASLDCVLAQRLARRLCADCKQPYEPRPEDLTAAGWNDRTAMPTEVYRSVGCKACGGTGYRGRLALHEVMLVSEQIERMIVHRSATEEMRACALEQGMIPLREDGLRKMANGMTTIEEISRVIA